MDEKDVNKNNPIADIDLALIKTVPREIIEKYQVMPVKEAHGRIVFACTTPDDIELKDQIEESLNAKIELVGVENLALQKAIVTYYWDQDILTDIIADIPIDEKEDRQRDRRKKVPSLKAIMERESSVIDIFDYLIHTAIIKEASDLHIEPLRTHTMIRIRIDGVLHVFKEIPGRYHQQLITYIKVESGMDITESRLPQDGQIEIDLAGDLYDLRVTSIPTMYGEKMAIRILGQTTIKMGLEQLGFSAVVLEKIKSLLISPSGLMLITGPTGSGKTSTLFALLDKMQSISKNIVTVEDPIEYRIPNVNQIEIKEKAGLTFETACRSLLRQDPDVILIGEIRDYETARLSVQSALAGTLLLSTLHSINAIGTIDRLINMGVERFWVGNALSAIIAQRLVRQICPHCKHLYQPDKTIIKQLKIDPNKPYFKGEGCHQCIKTGYLGRTCVSEILILNDEIKDAICHKRTTKEIIKLVQKTGFISFRDEAIQKIEDHTTTPEEIIRVLGSLI